MINIVFTCSNSVDIIIKINREIKCGGTIFSTIVYIGILTDIYENRTRLPDMDVQ